MNEDTKNENTIIGFRHIWSVIQTNLIKIMGWAFTGLIVSIIISYVIMTPKYSGTIDLLVNQKESEPQLEYNAQQADLQAINTYKDILKKPIVLKPVLKEIKTKNNYSGSMANLQKSISITNEANSRIVSVTVKDKNAYVAADVANSIGIVFSNKIKEIMKINNVTIVTKATPNINPISPNPKLNMFIGVFMGLIVGVFWFVIRDLFDTRVKDESFLTNDLGLTNLGSVGHISNKRSRHAVIVKNSNDELKKSHRV